MLPFGSITSIIPLFILGFVYFIYFSTAFFARYVPQESNETDFNKTIAVSDSGYSKEYPDFRDTNLHEIDAVTPEEFDFNQSTI